MMNTTCRYIGMGLIIVMLSGCSNHESTEKPVSERMLYSPNGEPLNGGPLGTPTCTEAMSHWFDRVDTNHDSILSREEFISDAQTQFQHMEIDHNGYLVSEELERYRRPFQPPQEKAIVHSNNATSTPHQNVLDHGKSQDQKKEIADDVGDGGDPVMSADTNLDFQVTPAEFTAHAQKKFVELDKNHTGSLSREGVLMMCKKR